MIVMVYGMLLTAPIFGLSTETIMTGTWAFRVPSDFLNQVCGWDNWPANSNRSL